MKLSVKKNVVTPILIQINIGREPQKSGVLPEDIYNIGTIGDVVHILTMPDGAIHALIKTHGVVNLSDITVNDGVFTADVTPLEIQDDMNAEQTLVLRDILADNVQVLANATRKFKMDKLRNVIENYPLPALIYPREIV